MNPKVRMMSAKVLVGHRMKVTMATDNPVLLWRPFKMKLKDIGNAKPDRFYSVQTFEGVDFSKFDANTEFTKWAAVEVSEAGHVPDGLEVINVPKGLYGTVVHFGTAADFPKTTDFMYREWLPHSKYELDNRPHLTIMPSDHRPDDPNAVELVCVPVKSKAFEIPTI
jgi:AraC family transcriptional regulator